MAPNWGDREQHAVSRSRHRPVSEVSHARSCPAPSAAPTGSLPARGPSPLAPATPPAALAAIPIVPPPLQHSPPGSLPPGGASVQRAGPASRVSAALRCTAPRAALDPGPPRCGMAITWGNAAQRDGERLRERAAGGMGLGTPGDPRDWYAESTARAQATGPASMACKRPTKSRTPPARAFARTGAEKRFSWP
jgi:hypothetical protein